MRMTKMTMAKIKLLRDKREVVLRQMRRYIGSDVTARIQNEQKKKMEEQGGEQQGSTIASIPQKSFSEAVTGIDNSTIVQSQPPTSASSSRLPPRQQLRLRDVKTLARLMGRLTEEEKRVILLLYNNNNNN
ncbi:uncharacterized protein LOC107024613 isoform X2 [Solanum pennellii]|uniref:Uncharacterized protein LOC107024613 isoform X2 n=1 Tax=Solanum pennellii TaxID=28526 RepID=A0ABM1H6P1_SOLPN|nr:uncharacterized protein LOC107024613 isoform X2 [Solanum pennellii]